MSDLRQRRFDNDDQELSNPLMRRLTERPVHLVAIGLLVIAGLFVMAEFTRYGDNHRNKDAEAALAAASGGEAGTAWTQPATFTQAGPPPKTQPEPQQPPPPRTNTGGSGMMKSNDIPSQHQSFQLNVASNDTNLHPGSGTLDGKDTALGGLLKPTALSGYRATRIKHPSTTIEEGRVLLCKQVQPLTSQLPGFVTAKLAYDAWSYDGTRRLLEADSTAFGEIAHGLVEGQDRLFVLWRQVTAPPPSGVRITLNSPAADQLGESGLPGDVDHHTWQKIGGALMLSGIQAVLSGVSSGLSAAIQNSQHDGNNGINNNGFGGINFYQFQGQGSSLASQLLAHTISIPDTLHRDQAMPCSIFVSGDLDFNDVYTLERTR